MLQKFQTKHQKRREANANERKRIQQLNDAIKRLKEATNQSSHRLDRLLRNCCSVSEKSKKSRKMTKLSIIKAAINHIYTLQELLSEERTLEEECVEHQDIISEARDHEAHYNVTTGEDSRQSLVPFSILTQSRRNSAELYDNSGIKIETDQIETIEVTEEFVSEQFVILEPSQESTIIPVEQEFATEYPPPLIYLDYHANFVTQEI